MGNGEIVWQFKTKNFRVYLEIWPDYSYQYDGDDPHGEIQAAIDSGEMVAFDSRVVVQFMTPTTEYAEIGSDSLGGSVYEVGKESEFWTAHRDRDPNNRNCSLMHESRGRNIVICHYFPDMVRQAVREARENMKRVQSVKIRA